MDMPAWRLVWTKARATRRFRRTPLQTHPTALLEQIVSATEYSVTNQEIDVQLNTLRRAMPGSRIWTKDMEDAMLRMARCHVQVAWPCSCNYMMTR